METMFIADAHTDYLMNLRCACNALTDGLDEQMHISLDSLEQGHVKLQVFAAFVGEPSQGLAVVQGLELVTWYYNMIQTWGSERILPITDLLSLDTIEITDAIGALLSIEGGEAYAGSLDVLGAFKRLGVRMTTLLWNHENEIGYPACDSKSTNEPLKPFGRSCVDFMCQNGIAIDVSHLNTGGFWDVYKRTTRPLLASHSNAHALCPHPRNLNDDQIRAIIRMHGFIGLNFYPGFLCLDRPSSINDIVLHARHILSLGGEDILGFGSDFDGIQNTPDGVHGAQSYPDILAAFAKAGIDGALLKKISYRNFKRYIGVILKD